MREAESQGLVKVTWKEGIVLCNTCYMNLIENPLRRGSKRIKVTLAKEVSTKIEFTNAIEIMSRHLYEGNVKRKKARYMTLKNCETCCRQRNPAQRCFSTFSSSSIST